MSNSALTTTGPRPEWEEKVDLIKRQLAPEASAAELEMFLYQARRTGLDPLARQVYLVTRNSKNRLTGSWEKKSTIQVSIDGMRLVAQRSGRYAGQTPALWCGKDGVWKDVWLDSAHPAAAKVGVYHADFKEPLVAVATWEAYCQTDKEGRPSGMWPKMGPTMLAKCAEMLALRKAFPQELSGLYGQEEMDQAAPVVEAEGVPHLPYPPRPAPEPASVPALPAPAPAPIELGEPAPAQPQPNPPHEADKEQVSDPNDGAVEHLKGMLAQCQTAEKAAQAWKEWRGSVDDMNLLNNGLRLYKARKAELGGK